MTLRTEWNAIRARIEAALQPAKLHAAQHPAARAEVDDREWIIVYRTADGFCCMYRALPVEFEDMLEVQTWAEEMNVRPYFMGL